MYDRPFLTLPEELLLACGDSETGRIQPPDFFARALSGAVLAELELCGAITIEQSKIVELRPLTRGEPIIDRLFEQLNSDIAPGQLGNEQSQLVGGPDSFRNLRHVVPPRGVAARASAGMRFVLASGLPNRTLSDWIRSWHRFRDIEERYVEAMEARGLVIAHRRRILGIVPRTTWTNASPEYARESTARIDEAIRAVTHTERSQAPSRRAMHLVALVGAADLSGRLFPGPEYLNTRRHIEHITSGNPIAAAVRSVREADEEARRSLD
jgi:hypothetical protein